LKKITGAGIAALALSGALIIAPAAGAFAADADNKVIIADTNDARVGNNLETLVENAAMNAVAQAWANQISEEDKLYHNPNVGSQIPAGWSAWGENVAQGYSPEDVVTAWLASPGHRANIMTAGFTDIGVGYNYADGRMYSVQVFATYPTDAEEPTPTPTPTDEPTTPPVTPTPTPEPTTPPVVEVPEEETPTDEPTETPTPVPSETPTDEPTEEPVEEEPEVEVTAPSSVRNIVAEATGSDSINVTWEAPEDSGNGDIENYNVNLYKADGVLYATNLVDGEVLSAQFTLLDPNTEYSVTVTAVNSAGASEEAAEPLTVRTLAEETITPPVVEVPEEEAPVAEAPVEEVTPVAPVSETPSEEVLVEADNVTTKELANTGVDSASILPVSLGMLIMGGLLLLVAPIRKKGLAIFKK
jgi:LPXTG-motif cell wall-anchored protein